MPWLIIFPVIVISIGLGFLVGLRQQKTEDEKRRNKATDETAKK